MAGRTDHLGAVPSISGHDAPAVEDVLDRILGLVFFDDCVYRHTLRQSEHRHDVGFYKTVMCWAACEDEVRRNAGSKLTNTLKGTFSLLG